VTINLIPMMLTAFWRAIATLVLALAVLVPAYAQDSVDWPTGIDLRGAVPAETGTTTAPQPASPTNTTVIPRTPGATNAEGQSESQIKLIALLTADGQPIDKGITWRIYEDAPNTSSEPHLIRTLKTPNPTVKLKPGRYIVNAAFGRAHLTRQITVQQGTTAIEQFVLNAGGLRVKVLVDGRQPAPNNATYRIYSDERDQFANRTKIISGAKPNRIIRLNAGIYHIVSTYGDANATVEADVTVEAGKLTEATITHSAAMVTFKLVARPGGEALPETQWTLQSPEGKVIKQSVGALPTHILAPGTYTIIAKSGTRAFKRDFTLSGGDVAQVEVLMR